MPLRGQIIAIVLLMAVLPALGLTKREEIAKGRKCGSAPKGSTHEEPHRQAGEISFPRLHKLPLSSRLHGTWWLARCIIHLWPAE